MADRKSLNMNKFFGESYLQVSPSVGMYNSLQINPKRIIENIEDILTPAIQQLQVVSQENSNQNNILQKFASTFDNQIKTLNDENQRQNNVLTKINSSFDSLISSATRMKNNTDNILKFIDEDLSEREKISKENEKIISKNTQKNKSRRLTAEQLSMERNNFMDASGAAAGMVGLAAAAGAAMGQPLPSQEPGGSPGQTSAEAGKYKELLDMIAGVESTSYGGYDAFNKEGRAGGDIAIGSGNSRKDPIGGTVKPLSERTVQEVMDLQAKGQLHATGRYQIIQSTLSGLMQGRYGNTGVKPTDLYDAATQDKLGIALINYRMRTSPTAENFRNEWNGLKHVNKNKLQESINRLRSSLQSSQQSSRTSPSTQPQSSAVGTSTRTQTTASAAMSNNSQQQVAMAQLPIQNDGITPIKMPPPIALSPVDTKLPTNQTPLVTMIPKETDTFSAGVTLSNDLFSREPIIDPQNYLAFSNRASLGLIYG